VIKKKKTNEYICLLLLISIDSHIHSMKEEEEEEEEEDTHLITCLPSYHMSAIYHHDLS